MSPGQSDPPPQSAASNATSGLAAWVSQVERRLGAVERRLGELEEGVQRLKGAVAALRPLPADLPLTPEMWCLLKFLSRRGKVTVSTLAANCPGVRGGHDRRAVKKLLEQLEGWELVGCNQKDQGRRWHLTGNGFYRVNHHFPPS